MVGHTRLFLIVRAIGQFVLERHQTKRNGNSQTKPESIQDKHEEETE
jgi:hypothetical protein